MLYVLGVLFAALGIAVSIALHEVGHLVPAKRSGLRVPQYMVGFGPTVVSWRRGETEYGIKAIPLGGYVKMIGMFPPKPGQREGTVRASSTGRIGQLIDEAREMSLEEMQPGDEKRVFYALPVWRKVMIMLGGPVMNLLIAIGLLTGIYTAHGVYTETPTLSSVSECVDFTRSAQSAAQECTPSMRRAPANVAGLRPQDRIVEVDGTAVSTWEDVRSRIRANRGEPMTLVVERDGRRVTRTARPIVMDLPVYDRNGMPEREDDGTLRTEKAGFLGASATPAIQPLPLTRVPGRIGSDLLTVASAVTKIPQKMVGVAKAATGAEREQDSPMSVVGVGRISGEVAAAKELGTAQDKVILLLSMLAQLNLMLFVFNLIPLLPLDGGHVAGALWEGTKKGWARLRGLPQPGPVDVAKALPLAYAVASVFLVMTAVLMYADIVNPVRLSG